MDLWEPINPLTDWALIEYVYLVTLGLAGTIVSFSKRMINTALFFLGLLLLTGGTALARYFYCVDIYSRDVFIGSWVWAVRPTLAVIMFTLIFLRVCVKPKS